MDAENRPRMALQTVQGSETPVPQILCYEYQIYVVPADEPGETVIRWSIVKSTTRQKNLQSSNGGRLAGDEIQPMVLY